MSAAASPEAVASSSTLWATASKEWVIPAKPKPGRKPKKDPAPPPDDDPEGDSKGRRVQNRAAQRAFRERKQSQLAELQARLQQYEQGEIERNVALQAIAKKLKEDNDNLRKENEALKRKLAQADQERVAQKRSRDEAQLSLHFDPNDHYARKRQKSIIDTLSQSCMPPMSYASSPSSASSPGSSDAHLSYSPMPMPPSARDNRVFQQSFGLNGIFDLATSEKSSLFEPGQPLDTFDCGFCNENTPCVCREIALQQVADNASRAAAKFAELERSSVPTSHCPAPEPQVSSILDNLPAYQPPVPLRRRTTNAPIQPIFPITVAPPEPIEEPSCTGDPANCRACADDAFGKAFCAAISQSVACSSQCKDCPGRHGGSCSGGGGANGCCGNPGACGRGGSTADAAAAPLTASLLMSPALTTTETIPCDDAWRQIKSHPNVAFSDLSLLAEVVARRSKCTGPRVEISPAPGAFTPERALTPAATELPSAGAPPPLVDNQPIILTDPHAQYHEKQQLAGAHRAPSPPRLVPQDVLVRCGRQRVREVMADGVRDALRLLDAKFAVP